MKKLFKIIIFIFLIMFMTGCSATYNITIEDNEIKDNLTVESNFSSNQIRTYTENAIPVDMNIGCLIDYDQDNIENNEKNPNTNYYNISSKNNTELNATSNMHINEYENSRIANSLFNNININNYEDTISIYGFNGVSAFTLNPDLESVTVNITVKNKKVLTNDADKVNNNIYTWSFNRNTDTSKTLYIEMENMQEKPLKNEQVTIEDKNYYSTYIILFIFVVSITALILIKIKDMKNKNS